MPPGSILTDLAIAEGIQNGDIEIDPYDPKQLNPGSYDLRLGDAVVVYKNWIIDASDRSERELMFDGSALLPDGSALLPIYGTIDTRKEPETVQFKIGPAGWLLCPGIGYLMHTVERVHTKKYVGVFDGKSSLGRLFVSVHSTAGYIDSGFDGQVTLEVTVTHPVRVYAGMRIGQIRFHTMHGKLGKPYDGNYKGTTSKGAVASQVWRQFEEVPKECDCIDCSIAGEPTH